MNSYRQLSGCQAETDSKGISASAKKLKVSYEEIPMLFKTSAVVFKNIYMYLSF